MDIPMIDYQNPTIEQIESLIPDSIRHKLAGIETTWSRPDNLRLMREWAHEVVPRKTALLYPEGHRAFWVVTEEDTPTEAYDRYLDLIDGLLSLYLEGNQSFSSLDRFVAMLTEQLYHNWRYFDAPMQVCKEFCLLEDKE
jgi:hypothetical protein